MTSTHGRRAFAGSIVLVGTFLASCAPSPCEQRHAWRNAATSACVACISERCAMEQTAAQRAMTACQYDFACMARCPDQSASTCRCIDTCLSTAQCRTLVAALTACELAHCSAQCQ